MALEALSSTEFPNFVIDDTIPATPYNCHDSLETAGFLLEDLKPQDHGVSVNTSSLMTQQRCSVEATSRRQNLLAVQGKKKRRRTPRVCKNREEAETQRMTHIAVERNRRKLMNGYLAVLRSHMPESFVQRGDQASIVGGAIVFVKELEHLLQSLEAKKLKLHQGLTGPDYDIEDATATSEVPPPPFAQFFVYPQYTWSQIPNKFTSKTKASIADIEVNLIETHANLRILSRRRPRQLSKLVAGFQTLYLTVLHINVTTMDPLVLYSISAKLEEGCHLTSVDDIAGAVHHMLRIIEEETALC
ncbi:PREDICTED: transcription factor bHLH71-like isoform X2 [Populus euphratica]|uniref:Transcription factor bHLH71-like isoform X2 n=1 Tax=Populus euphratica TaxID=75702 RepID=A0AAJ6XHB1_POPEU|nr:PREDICTED: transcription factor bHLH71-like isoform X2 [Populus euphratica]